MILRTYSSLILIAVISIGLSACGGTEDYETSNGSILWSDYESNNHRLRFSPDTGFYQMESVEGASLDSHEKAHNIVKIGFDGKREIIATVEPSIPMTAGQVMLLIKDEEGERIVVVGAVNSSDSYGLSTVHVTSIDTTTKNISSYILDVSDTQLPSTVIRIIPRAQDYGGRLAVQFEDDVYEVSPNGLSPIAPLGDSLAHLQPLEGLDIPDIPEEARRRVIAGYSQGIYVRIDYAEPIISQDSQYKSATVSAYDEEYNLIWRKKLEPDSALYDYSYYSSTTYFNDLGIVREFRYSDSCTDYLTTISETGLGDTQEFNCDEAGNYITDEPFYFKYQNLVEENAFLISKVNYNNETIEDYTFQYNPSVDSAEVVKIKLLDNGKLYVNFKTFEDTTSSSTPVNAEEDYENQTTLLILNEDLSLFSEIPIIKSRTVHTRYVIETYTQWGAIVYDRYYSDSTPEITIEDIIMSNNDDILFLAWGYDKEKTSRSSRIGAIH